ncbi:hypothetical protein KF728_13645 [Candidatus Obscuribacterales bacterium]|nr:hypothetical protein [Candidatus Obscuribacterales bacterium]MBX3151188.1 hypothetical protein [Candidatus Obscuribacterales bacterium]
MVSLLYEDLGLAGQLELAELQEKYLEDLLAGRVSPPQPPKRRKRKRSSGPAISFDRESVQARLEAKRLEISGLREQLDSVNSRIHTAELEREKDLEKIRLKRATELRDAISASGDAPSISETGKEQNASEILDEIKQRMSEQAREARLRRHLEVSEIQARYRAEREIRVLAARSQVFREFESQKRRMAKIHSLADSLVGTRNKVLSPISSVAKRFQKFSYELDPKIETAHERLSEKLNSANVAFRESQSLEEVLEERLKRFHTELEKWMQRAEYDVKERAVDELSAWSTAALDGAELDSIDREHAIKVRDSIKIQISDTELELRRLKLRNLFTEDYLSRAEAIVARITVIKELLEILPGSKVEKENRLDFVRIADAISELLQSSSPEETEPTTTLVSNLDKLEERVLRQYIRLAKNETPLSPEELSSLKQASEGTLNRFALLKSNEQEQKDAWESVYRKFEADGKEFAGKVAQTRLAQSERVIKTIDLATDAVVVLINCASISVES